MDFATAPSNSTTPSAGRTVSHAVVARPTRARCGGL